MKRRRASYFNTINNVYLSGIYNFVEPKLTIVIYKGLCFQALN
jgi:hypothetical protein